MNEDFHSSCHPFRSPKAKEEYLQLYDDRAEKWPVPSTTKMANTSYGKTFVRINGGWIASQYALKFPDRINKLVLLAPVGTVAQLSLWWVARAVLVALPFKYFSRKFVFWLAEDTLKHRKNGHSLIEEHIDETFMAVRSFKRKRNLTRQNQATQKAARLICGVQTAKFYHTNC